MATTHPAKPSEPLSGTTRRVSADAAVVGASIRTLWPERPHASAVAIRSGLILAVGDDVEVRDLCDARTEVIDGSGTALVPGLIDAHQHPIWGAELTAGLDLNGLKTLDEVRETLRRERERLGPDEWVRGWGLDYGVFPVGQIGVAPLAEALGEGPALLILFDLHTAVATPRALALAGVDEPRALHDGSEFVGPEGGLTGEVREMGAILRVLDAVPEPPGAERFARVRRVLDSLHAVGLTGVHAMDGSAASYDLLEALEARGELTMRMVVPLWQKPDMGDEELRAQLPLLDAHGRLWRGGVAKFFIDGVIESGTAWLDEPDALGDGTRALWQPAERYEEAVALFARAGFQCVTHAIGDRAVRAALDAYSRAGPPRLPPHRVEHAETLPDAELRRFAAEGVTVSMQPLHMQWRRPDRSDPWHVRLGAERSARAWRTRDLVDSGAHVVLGSDWPVAQYDPRLGMAWARLRRPPGDRDAPAFEPEQALTAPETLEGYTARAAAVVGDGARAGRIAPGLHADLTGFAEDPVLCPADDLVDLPVRLTMVEGRVVHSA
jgi:predicted amidohydrolase YtcJ